MQTVTSTTRVGHAYVAEPASACLDLTTAGELLRVRGYELVCRFGHVHAAVANVQEWHVCLIADLASMHPARFLVCLEESIQQSLQLTGVHRKEGP